MKWSRNAISSFVYLLCLLVCLFSCLFVCLFILVFVCLLVRLLLYSPANLLGFSSLGNH